MPSNKNDFKNHDVFTLQDGYFIKANDSIINFYFNEVRLTRDYLFTIQLESLNSSIDKLDEFVSVAKNINNSFDVFWKVR